MIYRKLTKNGEKVSQLGFGLMRLPTIDHDYGRIDDEKALPLIRYAIDQGVNYLDTAYAYHSKEQDKPGMSEPLLAKALRGGYREKVHIATKLPSWLIKSREDMDKYLDEQLQRLETEQIDFYLLHCLNNESWPNLYALGASEFLDRAKEAGKIKYAGFSFHADTLDFFKSIVDAYAWDICQVQYNYMDTDYCPGLSGIRYAAAKGIGVVIMEPLKGGTLATGLPASAIEAFHAAAPQKSPAEWSLRWLWDHPEIKVVLSGMGDMAELKENLSIASDARTGVFTKKDLAAIEKAKSILKERIKVGCTGCNYCMPCPQGVDIPKSFLFYNRLFMFDAERAKRQERTQYGFAVPPQARADHCIACRACEQRCPQRIKIGALMKEVAEAMKKPSE